MPNQTASPRRSKSKTILLAWLVAGTLDLLGAILVYAVIMQKTTAEKIVRGIAGGVFKKQATVFYFLIFPYTPFFRKQKILGGILYGAFIWAVMNLIVLNIVFPGSPTPTISSALIGAAILMILIGLPLSYFANKYYGDRGIK